MKTQEEIEQLAKEEYKDNLHNPFFTAAPMGYIKGYTQCQKDMANKKYTEEDLITAINQTIDACNEAQKESYGDLEIDVDKIINSLNKQD